MKKKPARFLIFILCGFMIAGCQSDPDRHNEIVVQENGSKNYYGSVGGDSVFAYTIKNNRGLKAVITNYGATLLELWTPDKSGRTGNIILGYDSLSGYLQKGNPYFGAIVGRYANRIHHGSFTLEGREYPLAQNDHGNTLHGGLKGFDKVVWTVNQVNDSSLALSYTSRDGEEGFPGNLTVKMVYALNAGNELTLDYEAITDKATPLNLTNHAYFNLSGGKEATILGEELTLYASRFTAVDDSLIPTGVLSSVKNTPMDFLRAKKIGRDIDQVKGGYDHNFVIDKKDSGTAMAATLYDPVSGRVMDLRTSQPGVQFYTGNFLNEGLTARQGQKLQPHSALCLETQHFPDSPNQPSFPNVVLEPGQVFHEFTAYRFSVKP